MATRNLLVRAGFDASGMTRGTRQANVALSNFGRNANRQMSALNTTMSASMAKIGKMLAGVFAVGAIIRFGRECVELGSNLAEVQNVVDTVFGTMAEDVNQFAKTAITSMGLSETSCKKYTSTMGAMLKSMGLGQKDVLDMSKSLTKLSADMASFYNLDADEAFAKIRSGISGETEPLKQLGINMSVANMEAYALSQGISKAYSKMSQSEQALLRYNYLLSVTGDAQGDFARTSDSWANQTRILNENWKALMATLGQGLINVFTPIVKWLNTIINKLHGAANAFTDFTNTMFGNAGKKEAGVVQTTEEVDSLADSADDATESIKNVQKATMGFDEVNILTKADDESAQLDATAPISDMADMADIPDGKSINDTNNKVSELADILDKVKKRVKELADLFKKGFKIGLGDTDFSKIKSNIDSIAKALKDIFTDKNVVESFNNMLDSWALNLGKIAGSAVSVGATVATNLTGGIAKYLEQNTQFIKDRLIGIFDISADIANIVGDFAVAFADVFSVFGGETAQQITADIISIFVNPFLTVTEVLSGISRDILNVLTKPFIDNVDLIKKAIENVLKPIQTLTDALRYMSDTVCASMLNAYYKYIKPAFDNIADAISMVVEALLDAFNSYIAPILQKIADIFSGTFRETVTPLLDKVMTVIGKLCELLGVLLKNYIAPIVSFLTDIFVPMVGAVLSIIARDVDAVIKGICGLLDGIFTVLEGVLDFLTGVFTLDWSRAWEGIKSIFVGIWEGVTSILKVPLNIAIAPINGIIDMLNTVNFTIPEWFSYIPGLGDLAGKSWGFDIPNIPQLAKGGVVDNATLAMIGEDGQEAVVPLENNTEWMDKFAIKLANAMGATNVNSGSSRPLNITLEADMRELAKAIVPYIPEQSRRLGVSFS